MRIIGVDVSGTDGRTIVDLLMRVGRDVDLALAHRIERGFSRENPELEVSSAEITVLLSVLDDPPDSLVELRGTLLREYEWRQREGRA